MVKQPNFSCTEKKQWHQYTIYTDFGKMIMFYSFSQRENSEYMWHKGEMENSKGKEEEGRNNFDDWLYLLLLHNNK